MRPDLFTHALAFDEALRRVLNGVRPIDRTERVSVQDAVGRVAAEDVRSAFDVPAFARAFMDGYAVRAADLAAIEPGRPISLHCAGQIPAGARPGHVVHTGECLAIATGAPLPDGADAVVMVERTTRDDDVVTFHERPNVGQHIGRSGSDITIGQSVVQPGHYVTPARAGALASAGATDVTVFAKPSVAILPTGAELVQPGRPLEPGQVHDINGLTVGAVVNQHGGMAHRMMPVTDDVPAITSALLEASTHDVIVCSGGSSVGARDLLVDAIAACGRTLFHGIAVRPGKPTLFGYVRDTPLFGMPGNPTSCLSNAYLLLVPFLRATARLPDWRPAEVRVPLALRIGSSPERHQFYTVRLEDGRAYPAFKSSGDITSMAGADGYVEIPAGVPALAAGEMVTVRLF